MARPDLKGRRAPIKPLPSPRPLQALPAHWLRVSRLLLPLLLRLVLLLVMLPLPRMPVKHLDLKDRQATLDRLVVSGKRATLDP